MVPWELLWNLAGHTKSGPSGTALLTGAIGELGMVGKAVDAIGKADLAIQDVSDTAAAWNQSPGFTMMLSLTGPGALWEGGPIMITGTAAAYDDGSFPAIPTSQAPSINFHISDPSAWFSDHPARL